MPHLLTNNLAGKKTNKQQQQKTQQALVEKLLPGIEPNTSPQNFTLYCEAVLPCCSPIQLQYTDALSFLLFLILLAFTSFDLFQDQWKN